MIPLYGRQLYFKNILTMKNILVTVDLEDNSRVLVEKAAELAEKFDSMVWVVHITEPDPGFVGYKEGPQYVRDNRADEIKHEHHQIREYKDILKAKGIKAEGLLIIGSTIEMILSEMNKLNIDLIIIGHHKHSFMYKIFGEVTDLSVLKKSKVPLLIVPL